MPHRKLRTFFLLEKIDNLGENFFSGRILKYDISFTPAY